MNYIIPELSDRLKKVGKSKQNQFKNLVLTSDVNKDLGFKAKDLEFEAKAKDLRTSNPVYHYSVGITTYMY